MPQSRRFQRIFWATSIELPENIWRDCAFHPTLKNVNTTGRGFYSSQSSQELTCPPNPRQSFSCSPEKLLRCARETLFPAFEPFFDISETNRPKSRSGSRPKSRANGSSKSRPNHRQHRQYRRTREPPLRGFPATALKATSTGDLCKTRLKCRVGLCTFNI